MNKFFWKVAHSLGLHKWGNWSTVQPVGLYALLSLTVIQERTCELCGFTERRPV